MSLTIVKSARRVLDLLEYFATVRRAATVSEVEQGLQIPQSSASVLLRSLVALGYLEYLPGERRFRPTLRVTKLGDWVEHGLPGALTAELEGLRDRLQETVILGRRQGYEVEFIYLLMGDRAVQFFARRNSLQPMTVSTVGRALLAQLPWSVGKGIVRRCNAEAVSPRIIVNEGQLRRSLDGDRRRGFSETDALFGGERDFHVIARTLPQGSNTEPLAIGVAGPRDRMIRNRTIVMQALVDWSERTADNKVA